MHRALSLVAVIAAACNSTGEAPAAADVCRDTADGANTGAITVDGAPVAFVPMRAFTYWECENDRLVVALTAGTTCDPEAADDRLRLLVYRTDLEDGHVQAGTPIALGDETHVHARFAMGPEEWGSCDGTSAGSLALEEADTAAGARVHGTFELPISMCSGTHDLPPGTATATFDVVVGTEYSTTCPVGGDPHPRDRGGP